MNFCLFVCFIAIPAYVKWYLIVVLICSYLVTVDMEHPLTCLLAGHLCIFGKIDPLPTFRLGLCPLLFRFLYMRSFQKKSSQHTENSLCDINVTWEPRRVDWNAHA